jgi:5-(carboxyamino)imidazole ribonucleotide synthase
VILPGTTLGLLGGGQLGRMFTSAARTMGYDVIVLDPDPASPAAHFATEHLCADFDDAKALEVLATRCAAVTTEFENPSAESLAWLAARVPVRPGASAVAIAQDRIREKTFFAENGFPVGAFAIIQSDSDFQAQGGAIQFPAILKTARFGYDGKGQVRVSSLPMARERFLEWRGVPCVLEQLLPLKLEVSVVLARGIDGAIATFPVVENQHQNGILDISIAPARISTNLAIEAQDIAQRLAEKLDYCGVLAVEFFVIDDENSNEKILINEIAPRPHNSGHYTIDACRTSQFEQQVRALCGLPLGPVTQHTPAVMVNLLGDVWKNNVLAADKILIEPNVKLHLYGKREARDGRKMGHYTVLGVDIDIALAVAFEIKQRFI